MAFSIEWGLPEMAELWKGLLEKHAQQTLDADETILLRKLRKTVLFLAENPGHPGLASHEISDLTKRYGVKVWQSYLENRKPAAGRMFWVYGPERGVITIIGLEPHPESGKSRGYDPVKLSKQRVVPPVKRGALTAKRPRNG